MRKTVVITVVLGVVCLVLAGAGFVSLQCWRAARAEGVAALRAELEQIKTEHPDANDSFLEYCKEREIRLLLAIDRLQVRIRSTADDSAREALQEDLDTERAKLAELRAVSAELEARFKQRAAVEARLEAITESQWPAR